MIRRSMKSILTSVWSHLRTLFTRMKKAIQHGTPQLRTVPPKVTVGSRLSTSSSRAAALILVGALCAGTVTAANVPLVASRPDSAGSQEIAADPEDPDLPEPELSGSISSFHTYNLTLDDEPSILSRGPAVQVPVFVELQPELEYTGEEAVLAEPVPSPTPAPSPVPSPVPSPTPTPIVFPTSYQVQKGESIWGIAECMYGSADFVDLICYANKLSFYDPLIFSGQVLDLPDPSTPIPAPAPAPAPAPGKAVTEVAGYSDEDIDLYLRIVAAECGAKWSYDGCLMVSQVIVNRVLSGRWGGLRNVLTAPRQFTPYSTGFYLKVTPTAVQRQAAIDALNGATAFGRDVLYFCTDDAYKRSAWFQGMPVAATFANTLFFAP